jgi:hypothetical protein
MPPGPASADAIDALVTTKTLASNVRTMAIAKRPLDLRNGARDRRSVDTGRKIRWHHDGDCWRPRGSADAGAHSRHNRDNAGQVRDRIGRGRDGTGYDDGARRITDVAGRIRRAS